MRAIEDDPSFQAYDRLRQDPGWLSAHRGERAGFVEGRFVAVGEEATVRAATRTACAPFEHPFVVKIYGLGDEPVFDV